MPELDDIRGRLKFIMTAYSTSSAILSVYHTKHGRHVKIDIPGWISNAEIIALQAILGSDPWRELENLRRIKQRKTTALWNVLFSTKWVGNKVVSRERFYSRELFTKTNDGYKIIVLKRRGG
jgi:hypothetical protein